MKNQTRQRVFPPCRRSVWALLALTSLVLFGSSLVPVEADDAPILIKTTLQIDMLRGSTYWPPNSSKGISASSWIPHVVFQMRAPVPSGSRCFIAFSRPEGSPWLEFPLQSEVMSDPALIKYETPSAGDLDAYAKKYTTAVGAFGFKIRLHDELAGSDQVLFSGKFQISRISRSQGTPETKNDADYSVDHDWTLPIGYLWFHPSYPPDTPSLRASIWLRCPVDLPDLGGYLYYQGTLIANTKGVGGSLDNPVSHVTSDERSTDPRWSLWDMCFNLVHKTAPNFTTNRTPALFILNQKPGDYEVKVLRKGQLCRDLKFTVGSDGKIVDTGIGAANKMGTARIIVPVKVLGTLDGPWKAMSWKTDAFYGNPLIGFTAP